MAYCEIQSANEQQRGCIGWRCSTLCIDIKRQVKLGKQLGRKTAGGQSFKQTLWQRLHQALGKFLPHTFGDQRICLTLGHHVAHQYHCLRCNAESEAGRKPGHAQNPHRILNKCLADVSQDAGTQIALTSIRVDQTPFIIARNGIDGDRDAPDPAPA